MQLILTSPPKVIVILNEISFSYGSPEALYCVVQRQQVSLQFNWLLFDTRLFSVKWAAAP